VAAGTFNTCALLQLGQLADFVPSLWYGRQGAGLVRNHC
jgi:hypothetical protein